MKRYKVEKSVVNGVVYYSYRGISVSKADWESASCAMYCDEISDEDMEDELNTIVDLGGVALDVFVRHRVYGCLRAELNVSSRRDVKKFLEEIHSGKSTPLKDVTSGYHYHTISADSEDTLDLIEQELNNKGYLCQN